MIFTLVTDAFHRSCLRYIFSIHWSQHITNDEVDARAGTPLLVTTAVKRGRMRLLDNVVHLDERVLAKQVLLAASRPPPWGPGCLRSQKHIPWLTSSPLQPTATSLAVLYQRSPDVATTTLCLCMPRHWL